MADLFQDLKYGLRMLWKRPGFTVVAVLSLALGIGANTTIFTMINAVFLQPIPVEEPSRVVMLYGTDATNAQGVNAQRFQPISRLNAEDYRDRSSVFTGVALLGFAGMALSSGTGDPEQVFAQVVSGNYFDLLGVKLAAGRGFAAEEDSTPGTHPVVVLSDGLFKRRFGSDASIVGRDITLNGRAFTVVGVAPPRFHGTFAFGGPDLYIPMAMYKDVATGILREWFDARRARILFTIARLKPGVTLAQAQSEVTSIGKQLETEFPNDNKNRGAELVLLPQAIINPNQRDDFVRAGGILMGAVGLVLLIACSNVANLLLARAAGREREIGIRLAMGASRGRLVRQLLTESLVLAAAAGVVGLLVAYWGRDAIWAFRPPFLNQADGINLALDGRVLGFTALVSLVTGIVFGLVPAFQASRPDLVASLKDRTGPASGLGRTFGPRNLLVMGQVALSLVALVGAGLFLRSLWNAQQMDPGFNPTNLVRMNFNLGAQGYDQARGAEFHRQLQDRLRALPMVQSATVTSTPPFAGGLARTVFPEGVDTSDLRNGVLTPVNSVTPGYFEAMGMRLLRGRDLTENDHENAPLAAVITEAMARKTWPNQEAVGRRFTFISEPALVEVVGVVADTKYATLGEDPQPIVFMTMRQQYSPFATLLVRTSGDPQAALGTIRNEVQAMERTMPLNNVTTFDETFAQVLWAPRMGAALLGIFGALALFLAGLGLYGVMSYSVSQRTQEIGVRIALGAQPGDVLKLVLGQGGVIVGIGLAAGLALGFWLARFASNLLFGVQTADPLAFGATALLLLVVALVACIVPARRAMRVSPMEALRYE